MTNGTDVTKFKYSGTDKVEDTGFGVLFCWQSGVTPILLTVSENGLPITIESGIENAVDI